MTTTVPSLDGAADVAASSKTAAAASGAPQAWPTPARAYYTVFVLALVVMFAEIDRGVMSLLVQPIEKDLHIQDAMMGALMGLFFGLFYTVFGLPTARFIDRHNRKNILALGLAVWSTATIFCGLAQNFVQLALARVFLGAGESVNGPSIFSIISDSFPKERLPRAIALMQVGVLAGGAFALIMGAVVIKLLMGMPPQHIPFVGMIRWWQMVFIIIGIPGLLVAVIQVLTVKEPARRGVSDPSRAGNIGMLQVLRYLAVHRAVFGPMLGSMAISALAMGALSWAPAFYQRTYGWQPAQIGMVLGIMSLLTTPVGLFGGVAAVEWLEKKGVVDAPMRVIVWGRLIALPSSLLMPLMPTPELALAMAAFTGMMVGATGSSQNAILQIVTPNEMRGQVTALYLFLFTVVGNSISPTLIGLITQFAFSDPSQLRYAMLTTSILFMPASLIVMWMGVKPYRRELTRLGLAPPPGA